MQRHMPIGYMLVDGKIQFDERTAAVVKEIFQDYLSGISTYGLTKELTEMGLLNANNKASWSHGSIGKILENIKYLGDEFYPQMIDTELFNQVQMLRKERSKQLGRNAQLNSANHKNAFTDKLRCGECGEIYRKYIEHCGRRNEKTVWKCKRYIYKNRVCCRCGFITDKQIEKAFLIVANRILSRLQILDRKPKKEPIPYSLEFHKLDQQIKELEAEGRYSSKELPALIYERAKVFYQTARINDADYTTSKMKQVFSGRESLREFDKELFQVVVKQITICKDQRLVVEFINGLTLETEY